MKSTVSQLMALGLSGYEAKAYLSLLRDSPSTAYEVARASGVPTSKIYEVLSRLLEKDVVSAVESEKTKKYIPLEPADFLNRQRSIVEMTVASLGDRLQRIRGQQDDSSMWTINDYDYLIDKAKRMIENAAATLLISVWKEEFELIEEKVREALQRSVQAAIVHFGQAKARVGQLYQHPVEETVYQGKNEKGLLIVADSREVLMGTIFKFGRVEGAWSRNASLATFAEDYIRHDVYIMKIIKRYDRLLQERFGSRYSKLRDVFRDEEVT
jgi:HTH-type transcriptional regulator, sugar sensing transcriptional regulator